jgi:hypothetical protein
MKALKSGKYLQCEVVECDLGSKKENFKALALNNIAPSVLGIFISTARL